MFFTAFFFHREKQFVALFDSGSGGQDISDDIPQLVQMSKIEMIRTIQDMKMRFGIPYRYHFPYQGYGGDFILGTSHNVSQQGKGPFGIMPDIGHWRRYHDQIMNSKLLCLDLGVDPCAKGISSQIDPVSILNAIK